MIRVNSRSIGAALWTICVFFSLSNMLHAEGIVPFTLLEHKAPVGLNAREPSVVALPDGRVVLSWTESRGAEAQLRMAILDDSDWSDARTIYRSSQIYINWADFPSVAVLADGSLAAHWLKLNGEGAYQYDVNIAFSQDEGVSWSDPVIPHEDRSMREHGFVSLVPDATGGMTALWLDGRSYDSLTEGDSFENAMQLRARQITPDGTMTAESLLDQRSCTCCQTSAVRTGSGDIVAAYRDRTSGEIRDISIVRQSKGEWSKPFTLNADGWEIAGCPVNGPAIDAADDNVSVIWFTAAFDDPKVLIAFSEDGGLNFDAPLRLDVGAALGRVDVLQMPNGSRLALWVEYAGGGEAIVLCHVTPDTGCTSPQALYINQGRGSVGFPRMARSKNGAIVTWTQPMRGGASDSTVRVVAVAMAP